MEQIGRFLIIAGLMIAAIGVFFMFGGKIPWLGRLPGDIMIEKKNFTFYFPIVTCLLISIALSIFFWLAGRK